MAEITTDATHVEAVYADAVLTLYATDEKGAAALRGTERRIRLEDIVRTGFASAGIMRMGCLIVETDTDKMYISFRRQQSSSFLELYNLLPKARVYDMFRDIVPSEPHVLADPRVHPVLPDDHGNPFAAPLPSRRREPLLVSPLTSSYAPLDSSPPVLKNRNVRKDDYRWLPPGESIDIGKYHIEGGMLYVGTLLPSANGQDIEPALINPKLVVDDSRPDYPGVTVPYWPAYHTLLPRARSAYLEWLADGRRDPTGAVTWPFMFFYGLERRILIDDVREPIGFEERHAITMEVSRLLHLYGGNRSFAGYVGKFLALLETQDPFYLPRDLPDVSEETWVAQYRVKSAVGFYAREGKPVPVAWALAWIRTHPTIRLNKAPVQRCPTEFEALFQHHYAALFGDGIVVQPNDAWLGAGETDRYRSASSGIGYVEMQVEIPDVYDDAPTLAFLSGIVDTCITELEPYSRYVGRNPRSQDSLQALALLPASLLSSSHERLNEFRLFLDATLTGSSFATVEGVELLSFWPPTGPQGYSKADAVSLAQLAEACRVGMEPDVRFGGAVLAKDSPVVLFRLADEYVSAPSVEYTVATLILHLASVVDLAGRGDPSSSLWRHIESALALSGGEERRLQAHFMWLAGRQVNLAGLSKRVGLLSEKQREEIGAFIVSLTTAGGDVSAEDMRSLTSIFKLLKIDPATLYSNVHSSRTGARVPPPASEPVTVQKSSGPSTIYTIPAPPVEAPVPPVFTLDRTLVAAKRAETAEVSSLLASIFADESPADSAVAVPATVEPEVAAMEEVSVCGLDSSHSSLLRFLTARESLTRLEFEEACSQRGLLPDGAIDMVNEAAYDSTGSPVLEEDDTIIVDRQILEEMLA